MKVESFVQLSLDEYEKLREAASQQDNKTYLQLLLKVSLRVKMVLYNIEEMYRLRLICVN
ncbi:MAG: hypothetical protein WBA84_09985 [Carnobacterium sp.]